MFSCEEERKMYEQMAEEQKLYDAEREENERNIARYNEMIANGELQPV